MVEEQMISTQQLMVAKCIMKDKENWMFAHLTANSEDPSERSLRKFLVRKAESRVH